MTGTEAGNIARQAFNIERVAQQLSDALAATRTIELTETEAQDLAGATRLIRVLFDDVATRRQRLIEDGRHPVSGQLLDPAEARRRVNQRRQAEARA